MRLVLIRHGQTESNVAGALDTDYPGAPLNEAGIAEAATLVEQLESGNMPRPDRIICSFIERAVQTSKPLAEACGLDVTTDERLREIRAGKYEMATDPESVTQYMMAIGQWAQGNLQHRVPDAESGEEVFARFHAAVTETLAEMEPDQTLAVVAHGAVIRYYTNRMAPKEVTLQLIAQHPVPNASFAVLEEKDGAWHCTMWGSKPIDSWTVDEDAPMEIRSSRELIERDLSDK